MHGFSGRANQALELLDPLHREVAAGLPVDDNFRLSVDTEYLTQLAQVGRYAEALAIADAALPAMLPNCAGRWPTCCANWARSRRHARSTLMC